MNVSLYRICVEYQIRGAKERHCQHEDGDGDDDDEMPNSIWQSGGEAGYGWNRTRCRQDYLGS